MLTSKQAKGSPKSPTATQNSRLDSSESIGAAVRLDWKGAGANSTRVTGAGKSNCEGVETTHGPSFVVRADMERGTVIASEASDAFRGIPVWSLLPALTAETSNHPNANDALEERARREGSSHVPLVNAGPTFGWPIAMGTTATGESVSPTTSTGTEMTPSICRSASSQTGSRQRNTSAAITHEAELPAERIVAVFD